MILHALTKSASIRSTSCFSIWTLSLGVKICVPCRRSPNWSLNQGFLKGQRQSTWFAIEFSMPPEMLKREGQKPKLFAKMSRVVINSKIILSKCLTKTTRNSALGCSTIIWGLICSRKLDSKSSCSSSFTGSVAKFILCKRIGRSSKSRPDRPLSINKFSPTSGLKLILIRS